MIALRLKSSCLSVLAIFFLINLGFQSMAFEASGVPDGDKKIHTEKNTRDAYPPDAYEPDDSYSTAKPITLTGSTPQKHNFSHQGDQDWVKFYAVRGEIYEIKVTNAGQKCDAVIDLYLYDRDGVTWIKHIDDYGYGRDELLSILIFKEGVYYARITNYNPNDYGSGTEYSLIAYRPIAGNGSAYIDGNITDSITGLPISGAYTKADNNATYTTGNDGKYDLTPLTAGSSYTLTFAAVGYETKTQYVTIPQGYDVEFPLDIKLNPSPASWQIRGVGDFNGDRKSDILLQNSTTGAVAEWLMNGATVTGGGYVTSSLDSGWQIKGVANFNGDGYSDILLYNSTTGMAALWLLNGTTINGGGYVSSPLTDWQIKGVGDFNGDGKSDILLYNFAGDIVVWLLNGTTITGGGYVTTALDPGWQIAGVGDFNGDGRSDILLYNVTSGTVAVLLMNGATIIGGGIVTTSLDSAWQIAGVGDFNGDGMSDILLQNSSAGTVAIWLLNGYTVIGGGTVTTSLDPVWQIAGVGDFNGDRMSDILLRNSTTGTVTIWLLNGTTLTGASYATSSPAPGWPVK